jgi:hypothetical protein
MLDEQTPAARLEPLPLGPLPPEPLVSVLISNYNYAHLAGEAIESVCSQTYPNLELLLCDDGSTDNSVELFRKHAARDPRIKVIAKSNGGQATGFNAGYRLAHGDIFCFLDTDDVYRRDKIERVVEAFRKSPEAGCVVNRLMRVGADRRPQGPLPLLASLPTGWYGPRLLKTGGVLTEMPGTPGLNLRREIAERIFPVPEYRPLNMCPDMVMLRLAPLLTPIASISEPLAEARLHGGNTYMRSRLNAESITRELTLCRELWEVQRQMLDRLDPALAREFAPYETDPMILAEKYMLARLNGDRRARAYHREMMRSEWMSRNYARWFWRSSVHLPKPLFAIGINTLLVQSRWKQLLSKSLLFLRAFQTGQDSQAVQ